MKRSIIIAASIVLVAGLTAGSWFWFFKIRRGVENNLPSATTIERTPSQLLTALTNYSLAGYWEDTRTHTLYELAENGDVYRKPEDGDAIKIEGVTVLDPRDVIPSASGRFAAVHFGKDRIGMFSLFDVDDRTWTPLPEGTEAVAWNPKLERIAYAARNGTIVSVRIFDPVTKKTTEVIKLTIENPVLTWVIPGELYLSEKPTAGTPSSLWSLDIAKKTLKPVVREESGLSVRWAPDGSFGLKSTSNSKETVLVAISPNNQVLRAAPFITLPEKCVLTEEMAYCGVPTALKSGSILPDDYFLRRIHAAENIVAWNLSTGEVKTLIDGTEPILIDGGIVQLESPSLQGSQMLFINAYDKKLYSVEITSSN